MAGPTCGGRSWRSGLYAAALLLVIGAATAAAAVQDTTEVTAELEKALLEDYSTLHFRHLKARARRGETPETLLALDFPNHDKFVILLDRISRKVLFETVSDGLTTARSVSIPSLRENNTIKSLVVEFQQKDPSQLTVDVHINCESHGQTEFPTSPRKMMEGSEGEPKLHIFRERHHLLEAAGGEQRAALMERLGCPLEAERMQGMQAQPESENPNRHLPPPPNRNRIIDNGRGDISIMHGCDECEQDLLAKTMSELIAALKRLREEVEFQRSETRHLREILEQCEICKPGNYRQG